MNRGKNTCT